MTENFKSLIIEDIQELIKRENCFACLNRLNFSDVGGFEHEEGNCLDLLWPICKQCWKHDALERRYYKQGCFSSLEEILFAADGELTEEISLLDIEDPEDFIVPGDKDPEEVDKKNCNHEFKQISSDKLRCIKCYKRVNFQDD